MTISPAQNARRFDGRPGKRKEPLLQVRLSPMYQSYWPLGTTTSLLRGYESTRTTGVQAIDSGVLLVTETRANLSAIYLGAVLLARQ
jgi:hypothetical protein